MGVGGAVWILVGGLTLNSTHLIFQYSRKHQSTCTMEGDLKEGDIEGTWPYHMAE